jgi:hypothetical protein
MTDTELLDWVERDGIQIWPQRKSKHGPVMQWWVQNVLPWVQTYDKTLRGALHKLAEAVNSTSAEKKCS